MDGWINRRVVTYLAGWMNRLYGIGICMVCGQVVCMLYGFVWLYGRNMSQWMDRYMDGCMVCMLSAFGWYIDRWFVWKEGKFCLTTHSTHFL